MKLIGLVTALAVGLMSTTAFAQSLVIGAANDTTSMDPHFHRAASNQNWNNHVFERLIEPGRNGETTPVLAESWENEDETHWLVHIRQGIKFHNGNDLTAEDVVFSMERAPNVPNSPASWAAAVVEIADMEIVDDYTIRFTTHNPSPKFIEDIGQIHIVDSETAEGMETEDYNSGAATIGTGPYKFVSWTPGDRMELVRNDEYWGQPQPWENVTIRFIGNAAARVAALRSGSVDLIDQVPQDDIATLESDPNTHIYAAATYRIIYLGLNQRDDAPGLTDANGQPLAENPLQDVRVRQALNLMVDRQAIVDRLLQGAGEPANQFVNSRSFGFNADLPPYEPDLEQARALLAEAGYPEGFGFTVYSSNDRFPKDGDLAQVLGQMFARGGMDVEVVTLPYTVYSKDAGDNKYSFFTFTYGNATAESLRGLIATLHTQVDGGDLGTLNRFGYSNPDVDAAIEAASREFDAAQHEAYLKEAAQLIYDDVAFMPMYFQNLYWASSADVDFDAWSDERSFAWRAKPAQ